MGIETGTSKGLDEKDKTKWRPGINWTQEERIQFTKDVVSAIASLANKNSISLREVTSVSISVLNVLSMSPRLLEGNRKRLENLHDTMLQKAFNEN